MYSAATFRFLNKSRTLGEHGWDDPAVEKLWRYNLHYFDDLNAAGATERRNWHRDLMLRWIRENDPGAGTGWEPYPTSLRIVNWIKWALAGNVLDATCLHSLVVQTRWLSQSIETHLLGNHLFSNAKALLFAGSFFDGPEADRWQNIALAILDRELTEQILSDGGHFERSPMYHALALEDMLDLLNLLGAFNSGAGSRTTAMSQRLRDVIPRMLQWLAAMIHPDGEISFFNDAAFGIAPAPAELFAYAERLCGTNAAAPLDDVTDLAESGYVRLQADGAVALLDVAPIGPDYLPAHAHADTLSFELSLFGKRSFVNSGTSCYGSGTERLRQRGTAAHNTVVIRGENSSEVWGSFRVARRARPVGLRIQQCDSLEVSCAHDGYCRLPGAPVHKRAWKLTARTLLVQDEIIGRGGSVQARFHLHPSVRVIASGAAVAARFVQLEIDRRPVRVSVEGGDIACEPSTWHPQFGLVESSECVVANFRAPVVRTLIEWNDAD